MRAFGAGRLQVYVELTESSAANLSVLNAVPDVQTEIVNSGLNLVQAWVPYAQIEAVARLPFVLRVRRPEYARLHTGSITSEGDSILRADLVRTNLGITGLGVKVGVISDGANDAASAQATGDLPAAISLWGSCNPAFTGTTCNEGTAMMEIVHDLAPGAELGFGCVATSLDFIQRVADLKDWGAQVIVDDVGFYGEPYFEDGAVAGAYAAALTQGIVMVTSAGNDATRHYQGMFTNNGSGVHLFSFGNPTMRIETFPGNVFVFLQWSSHWESPSDRFQVCLTDLDGLVVYFCGDASPTHPISVLGFTCLGPTHCVGHLRVHRVSGVPQTLEMFIFGPYLVEYQVPSDSITGHAAVPGILAIGASHAFTPLDVATFSSQGPSTVYFPTFQARATPALTAVDAVEVTGVGGFGSPFYGTSAAAPHVAGVAALLLEAKPSLTPQEVASAMQNTARDIVQFGNVNQGYDYVSGYGLVDAWGAVSNLNRRRRGQTVSE
ncbi:MAG: S8 family serine peptidase [Acidobacteria bacterium]|nr:S8 family serine peptidase [Acidobacteriota bacterium]